MRILVAEDEKDMNRIICKRLKEEGYSVDSCFDGVEVFDYLACAEYDAIVLDIMMPRMDGLQVLRKLRADNNQIPVLLLTAKDRVEDRVTGLDAGADDYLVKPFAIRELLARIRVMLRKPASVKTTVYTLADLEVHTDTHQVIRANQELHLSAKEFSLLRYMIQNAVLFYPVKNWSNTSGIMIFPEVPMSLTFTFVTSAKKSTMTLTKN